ncbi:MAG: hypothetical protein GW778_00105 [Alphaproteobacteria bacterium]|nr:hypothetical protein [Alphaproteobacteria bacterium]
MLNVTDFSAFERMLNNMMDGNANVFDLRGEFSANASAPSVAQVANFDFAPSRDVA